MGYGRIAYGRRIDAFAAWPGGMFQEPAGPSGKWDAPPIALPQPLPQFRLFRGLSGGRNNPVYPTGALRSDWLHGPPPNESRVPPENRGAGAARM